MRGRKVTSENESPAESGELLSLVVPVYFEEECIEQFIAEATVELEKNRLDYEIVFVDDELHSQPSRRSLATSDAGMRRQRRIFTLLT